ncbi:MAG: hypothetical protein ABEJ05_13345, partial [Haloglomus sp.]
PGKGRAAASHRKPCRVGLKGAARLAAEPPANRLSAKPTIRLDPAPTTQALDRATEVLASEASEGRARACSG